MTSTLSYEMMVRNRSANDTPVDDPWYNETAEIIRTGNAQQSAIFELCLDGVLDLAIRLQINGCTGRPSPPTRKTLPATTWRTDLRCLVQYDHLTVLHQRTCEAQQ